MRTAVLAGGTVLAAALLIATLSDLARAARPASEAERQQILGPRFSAEDFSCFSVTVSTQPAPELFARLAIRDDPGPNCPVGDGFQLLAFDPTNPQRGWLSVFSASYAQEPCRELEDVPPSVGTDLEVCFADVPRAQTTVTCWGRTRRVGGRYETPIRVVRRPRSCSTLSPSASFAEGVNLTNLRWRRWGSSIATARGLSRGFKYQPNSRRLPRYRATVRVSRPVESDGVRWYTRISVKTRFGTARRRLDSPDTSDYSRLDAPG